MRIPRRRVARDVAFSLSGTFTDLVGQLLGGRLDPGPVLAGNAYRDPTPSIPTSWPEALLAFERSGFVREYLGERFARLYAQTRRGEMQEFSSCVPAIDYDWYLTTS